MNGWSVQYASGANAFSLISRLLTSTLKPGQYFLVQLASGGAAGAPLPSTPDFVPGVGDVFNYSATAGKVALVSEQIQLTCGAAGSPCNAASIVDLVGYGTSAAFEGTAAPAGANALALVRNANGCAETDNNAADFSVSSTPPVRNMASPLNPCGASDAGAADSGTPVDSGGGVDAGPVDTGTAADTADSSSSADSAGPDSAAADTALADTALADTAVADTALADTALADTAVDSGTPDSGTADSSAPDSSIGPDSADGDATTADTLDAADTTANDSSADDTGSMTEAGDAGAADSDAAQPADGAGACATNAQCRAEEYCEGDRCVPRVPRGDAPCSCQRRIGVSSEASLPAPIT